MVALQERPEVSVLLRILWNMNAIGTFMFPS